MQPSGPSDAAAGEAPPLQGPSLRGLIVLLAAFTSLIVLTTDVYLPVLPQLGRDLDTGAAGAAATLSAVLVGIAVGQLLIGPITDAVGRKRPLLLGLCAYAITQALAALAPTIGVLLAIRVLTGLATAAVLVSTRAVVPDVFPGAAMTRAYATLGAVTGVTPVLAPVLGGLLAHVMGWRGMFVLLALVSLLFAVAAWRQLPETHPVAARTPAGLAAVIEGLWSVARVRRFLAYVVALCACGGVLFAYIGGSSFVLENEFGLSPQAFSLAFALNSVGLVSMSWTTRHFATRVGPGRWLVCGQVACLFGVGVVAVGVGTHLLPILMAGLFVTVASLGGQLATASALGMQAVAGRAGAAAGVMGICQFTAGAIASPLSGGGSSPWSLVVVMLVFVLAGLVLRPLLLRHS